MNGLHLERNRLAFLALVKRNYHIVLGDRGRQETVAHPALRVGPSNRLQIDGDERRIRYRIADRERDRAMAAVCPQGLVDVFLQYRNFAAAMFPDGRRKFLARVLPGTTGMVTRFVSTARFPAAALRRRNHGWLLDRLALRLGHAALRV